MAEIYRARTRTHAGAPGRWVAIKLMRHALGHEELREQLFKREARIASMLHHHNIVELYEFGSELDRHFLAMEYMRGRDLSHLIRGQSGTSRDLMPFELALFIAFQAAGGLGYAHRLLDEEGRPLEIIHRDISPGNVIIDYSGTAKVLDFGVARMNESQGLRTQTGTLRGKFAYMSPEQTLGGTIDARSDVFSLGTLLYEVLTGANPFRAKAPIQTLERVQGVRPSPPSRVQKEVPKDVDALLARCLAKDPRRRFRDALELHEAIGDFLARRGGDHQAQLARFMAERFAWEKEEEERELESEEEEVALLEVVDFSLGADDPNLDAPRVIVSHPEEASQQEVSRRSLRAAEDEESAYGVFDGRTKESGLIPERQSEPAPPPKSEGPAAGLEMRSLFESTAPVPLRSGSPERRPSSGAGQREGATIPIPVQRPDSGLLDDAGPTRAIRHPAVDAEVTLARRSPPREGSQLSDPMLKALVASAPIVASPELPPTLPESAPARGRDSNDAFREPAWWQHRPVIAGALGAAVSLVVVTVVAMGFAGRSEQPRSTKPTTTIAPVTIELPVAPAKRTEIPPVAETRDAPDASVELDASSAMAEAETTAPVVLVDLTQRPSEEREPSPEPKAETKPEPKRDSKRAANSSASEAEKAEASEREERRRSARAARRSSRRSSSAAAPQIGYLNVAAEPWAEIFIDGKKWPYQTPQWGIELPPGKHVVRLYNKETNVAKTETVYIKPGGKRTLTADLRR